MLRICLIIAIVAGIAAGAVSFFKVQEVMKETMEARDKYYADWNTELGLKKKALAELDKTKTELNGTKKELASTQSQLKSANAKVTQLEKDKTELAANLSDTKSKLTAAENKLTTWELLQITPQQVVAMKDEVKKLKIERSAIASENKILNQKVLDLNNELEGYRDPNRPVQLPLALKAKVLAVDPKFDFIVLDAGKNKNVLERGEMLVSHDGNFVAKVRIATVKEDRSIANIVSGWKLGEVMEGDALIASKVQ